MSVHVGIEFYITLNLMILFEIIEGDSHFVTSIPKTRTFMKEKHYFHIIGWL